MSINDRSLYLCSMLLKALFLLPHLFCNVDFEIILLIEFQNKTNIVAPWCSGYHCCTTSFNEA